MLGNSVLQASEQLNKNEVGICISPLIELAQPDVGLDSQKHRQACFQVCNGDGGRQTVCPASLQSMHWIWVSGTFKTKAPDLPLSHQSQDDLCKMPYFFCQLDLIQMSMQIRKCFLLFFHKGIILIVIYIYNVS